MNDEQKYEMYGKLTKLELVSMLVEASNMVENMIHSLEVHESDPIYKSPINVTNAVKR